MLGVKADCMGSKFRWFLVHGMVFILLAGCSDVRPLYGTNGQTYSESVTGHLADIEIPEPKSRVEQLVRNDLLSAMSALQSFRNPVPPANAVQVMS